MFHWFDIESLIFQILALRFYDNINDLYSEENMKNNFGESGRIVLQIQKVAFGNGEEPDSFLLKGFDYAVKDIKVISIKKI